MIRIRLSCRGRVEYFDLDASDVVLGRGAAADLSIDHPSILSRHARVLVRRGRLILAELGGLVALGEDRLYAPTTLREGETFRVGDVHLAAWTREPSHTGRSIGSVMIGPERDPFAIGTRRYEASLHGRRAEAMVLEDVFAPHEVVSWQKQMSRSALLAIGEVDGRPAIAERVPSGIRLATMLDSLATHRIAVSPEVALAILRRLAEALVAHHELGPHAGLVPGAVQLTMEGDVALLRSGPKPTDPIEDGEWCSENRRMNLPPSIADDAFALSQLAKVLGEGDVLLDPESIRTRGAFEEWTAQLVTACDRRKVDPSAAHVARVVRLLSDRGRPLGATNLDEKRDRSR